MQKAEPTVNVQQAREMINCSRQYVYQLVDSGRLRGFRIGEQKGIRIYTQSIRDFLAERRAAFGE